MDVASSSGGEYWTVFILTDDRALRQNYDLPVFTTVEEILDRWIDDTNIGGQWIMTSVDGLTQYDDDLRIEDIGETVPGAKVLNVKVKQAIPERKYVKIFVINDDLFEEKFMSLDQTLGSSVNSRGVFEYSNHLTSFRSRFQDIDIRDNEVIYKTGQLPILLSDGSIRKIRMLESGTIQELKNRVTQFVSGFFFLKFMGRVLDPQEQIRVLLGPGRCIEVYRPTITVRLADRSVRWPMSVENMKYGNLVSDLLLKGGLASKDLENISFRCRGCGRRVWSDEGCFQRIISDCCRVHSLDLEVENKLEHKDIQVINKMDKKEVGCQCEEDCGADPPVIKKTHTKNAGCQYEERCGADPPVIKKIQTKDAGCQWEEVKGAGPWMTPDGTIVVPPPELGPFASIAGATAALPKKKRRKRNTGGGIPESEVLDFGIEMSNWMNYPIGIFANKTQFTRNETVEIYIHGMAPCDSYTILRLPTPVTTTSIRNEISRVWGWNPENVLLYKRIGRNRVMNGIKCVHVCKDDDRWYWGDLARYCDTAGYTVDHQDVDRDWNSDCELLAENTSVSIYGYVLNVITAQIFQNPLVFISIHVHNEISNGNDFVLDFREESNTISEHTLEIAISEQLKMDWNVLHLRRWSGIHRYTKRRCFHVCDEENLYLDGDDDDAEYVDKADNSYTRSQLRNVKCNPLVPNFEILTDRRIVIVVECSDNSPSGSSDEQG